MGPGLARAYGQLPGNPLRCARLVGDLDNLGLIASNEAAAERIPDCELIRMPGVDHYPTMRTPRLVTEAILRHMRRAA